MVIYWNLPLELTRRTDIQIGNTLLKNINSYQFKYNRIPEGNDWLTLDSLGFKSETIGTKPSYACNRHGEYELIFIEGFDGPYLMWNSGEKKWKIDFPTLFVKGNSVDDQTESTTADHKVSGRTVIFLRPSEKTWEALENENGIYEVDSDFGFAISRTIDALTTTSEFQNIRTEIFTARYIEITDCKNCPRIIDRDSIYYGLILTATNREIKILPNVQTLEYLDEIKEYYR